MSNNFFYTVKNLSKSENRTLAYWMYLISRECETYNAKEEFEDLYFELVKALGLEEHARKVVQAYVKEAKKNKDLTPVKNVNRYCNPFDMRGELTIGYREDEDIYDKSGQWKSRTIDQINLVRAIFAGDQKRFTDIIACTFFAKPNKGRMTFTIPEDVENLPDMSDYEKCAKNYDAVKVFTDAFKLTEEEAELLNFVYLSHVVKEIFHVCNSFLNDEDKNRSSLYAIATKKSEREIKLMLRSDKKLSSYGIINEDNIDEDTLVCIYSGDINSYFSDVLKEDENRETYDLDSFSVKEEESELALRLLQNQTSTNLLLYGAAGAGKTEYARALVKKSGLQPLVFKNELEVNNNSNGNRALTRLNCLLSLKKKDSVIIVDEAESVLSTGSLDFFSMLMGKGGSSSIRKGTVNTMLENSENKVIWILNYTDPLDESTLRRFTYSIRFNEMTGTMLKNIADSKLNKINMKESLHSQLVELCGKYRVTGASVDNMVKTIKGMDLNQASESRVISDVTKVLEANSALIFGKSKMREVVGDTYDLTVLNSTTPAEKIVRMIENAQKFSEKHTSLGKNNGIRMLFYGVSGTGKTELARYIAEKLNKKIVLKRASDIMSKYVGENEKNIKEAFEEAEASGAILLFDEADSFFADRSSANTGWERTMVNEFLTQMEEFNGILICTTNLRKIMDPAMQRRFHILSEFKPLNEYGIGKLMHNFFGDWNVEEKDMQRLVNSSTVTPGDFGALAGKLRFMEEEEISGKVIVDELMKIQEEKLGERHIGFAC